MSLSLNILADQQKEISEARSNPINRLATIISLLSMTIMIIVLFLYKRED